MQSESRQLALENFEERRLFANVYEPSVDPAVGAIVTAFIESDPANPNDSWDIESNWKTAATELADVGASEVTFAVYRTVSDSGRISGGPSIAVVDAAVQHAKQLGLAVTLLPVFNVDQLGWRGLYNPSGSTQARFQSDYTAWIREMASIENVDRLNVGSELNAMVGDLENRGFFADLIRSARGTGFNGQLGYAANFDSYSNAGHAALWQNSDIDFIGVSAYFSLIDPRRAAIVESTGSVTVSAREEMVAEWTRQLDSLSTYSKSVNLPVVIQEFGATQRNYSSVFPWAVTPGEHLSNVVRPFDSDAAEQAATYESLLIALDGRKDDFESVFFWAWEHGSDRGERFYEDVDPSETRYINHFAIWPTDGGAGEYLAEFIASAQEEQSPPASRNVGFIDLMQIQTGDTEVVEFSARQAGLVTVIAEAMPGRMTPSLELRDASGELVATSDAGETGRLDVLAEQGETFTLQIDRVDGVSNVTFANLLRFEADQTVHLAGTSGDDKFTFAAARPSLGNVHFVSAQSGSGASVDYALPAGQYSRFTIHGSRGADELSLLDGAANDAYVAFPGGARMSDQGQSYSVVASGMERVVAHAIGGGIDTARFQDSAGADHFYADEQLSLLNVLDGSSVNAAVGFEQNDATSRGDLGDVAILHDGPGVDRLAAQFPTTSFELAGGPSNSATGFAAVHAFSTQGQDEVRFEDSSRDETFYVDPTQALLFETLTSTSLIFAGQFDEVAAFARNGGEDIAVLKGGDESEVFTLAPASAVLASHVYEFEASGFERAYAYASDQADRVVFNDSAGDDTLVVTPEFASLSSSDTGYANYATGFTSVTAIAFAGGLDRGFFYDSVGVDRVQAQRGKLVFELGVSQPQVKRHEARGFAQHFVTTRAAAVDFLIEEQELEYGLTAVGDWVTSAS